MSTTDLEKPWERYLGPEDRAILARGRFGRRMGFGKRPAIVAIDCQRYMVGIRGETGRERYPSTCGEIGWQAVDRIGALLDAGRNAGIPIFLTRFALNEDASDIGVYRLKRDFMKRDDWCIEGTEGAELLPEIGPKPGDTVFVKKKPSGFLGTPLLSYLIDRQVDTVIVVGGATSNCVRATVFDSSSYNFRTIVPHDAVFDRLQISHAISLFDMDRQFADVMNTQDVIDEINKQG